MDAAAWFSAQSFNARQTPAPAALPPTRPTSVTFDRWDAAKGRFRTFMGEWNETTGIYDRNVREVTT